MPQVKQRNRIQCSNRTTARVDIQPSVLDTQTILLGAKQVYEALSAPASQKIGNFDIASSTIPARHVSGDFVSTFEQNGKWFLALGDLMGKGLSAAMWLTHVLDLLHRACGSVEQLPEIMAILNREMHRSRVGVPLASLFLARLDPQTSKLTYSCGGCPPAFLLGEGQRVTMLDHGGPILGALETAKYASEDVELNVMDTLLVVSDGIIEVHHGVNFDIRPERVASHLRYTSGQSAGSIVKSLMTRVREASLAINDDLTVMAIQRVE
jgi:serine phosphatase RsbU (regulator of sigma subunit)